MRTKRRQRTTCSVWRSKGPYRLAKGFVGEKFLEGEHEKVSLKAIAEGRSPIKKKSSSKAERALST